MSEHTLRAILSKAVHALGRVFANYRTRNSLPPLSKKGEILEAVQNCTLASSSQHLPKVLILILYQVSSELSAGLCQKSGLLEPKPSAARDHSSFLLD